MRPIGKCFWLYRFICLILVWISSVKSLDISFFLFYSDLLLFSIFCSIIRLFHLNQRSIFFGIFKCHVWMWKHNITIFVICISLILLLDDFLLRFFILLNIYFIWILIPKNHKNWFQIPEDINKNCFFFNCIPKSNHVIFLFESSFIRIFDRTYNKKKDSYTFVVVLKKLIGHRSDNVSFQHPAGSEEARHLPMFDVRLPILFSVCGD